MWQTIFITDLLLALFLATYKCHDWLMIVGHSVKFEDLISAALLFTISTPQIPWTEEPGGLQSMGSQRVGHEWANDIFTLYAPNNALNILILKNLFIIYLTFRFNWASWFCLFGLAGGLNPAILWEFFISLPQAWQTTLNIESIHFLFYPFLCSSQILRNSSFTVSSCCSFQVS